MFVVNFCSNLVSSVSVCTILLSVSM